MVIHKIEKSFIQFSFHLNKHFPGLIDSYFGPKEIPEKIRKGTTVPLGGLLEQSEELLGEIKNSNISEKRRAYTLDQLQGLKFFLEHKVLNKYSHKELISKIYQFDFEYADDAFLSQRISKLDRRERSSEKLYGKEFFNYFKSKITEFKEGANKFFEVPENDNVEVVEGAVQIEFFLLLALKF